MKNNNLNIVEFISWLHNQGINISTNGEKLFYDAPKGIVNNAIRLEIAERKIKIIEFLQQVSQASKTTLPPIQAIPKNQNLPHLSGEILSNQLDYWKQQLNGAPEKLQLPTDYPRPSVQTYQGDSISFTLNQELTTKLQNLARDSGTTLFMTLYAAFSTLLSRYSGQLDIVVGTTIANRNRSEIEGLIGFFVNTLVLRTNLENNPSFQELLTQVRETTLKAYEHQDVPFEQVVEALQPQRYLSHSPLFQVMFILQNAPMGDLELPGVTLSPIELESTIAKFDLTLSMTETEEGLVGAWEYNTDLFKGETIERMVTHFQNLLEAVVENPSENVGSLGLLSESERHQLLVEWNDTATEYPSDKCIHFLFEEQVEKTPNAIAVVFEDEQLTYEQLNQRANQLAHYLQSLGVKPEEIVGICIERSLEMIVGVLGILKAGGAYLPLDPTYPKERLAFMLSDSQVSILLTTQTLVTELPEHHAQVVCLDTDWAKIARESDRNLDSGVTVENLAYLIYTSGSTGTPKGVLVTHEGLGNLTEDKIRTCKVRPDSRILQFFSLSFDASIPELVMALGSGAALHLASPEDLLPGPALMKLLREQAITHITLPPSALAVLPADELPALQMVLVGGEAPSPELITQWSKGRLFINAYGPTETTVNASMVECGNGGQTLPTVRPAANKQLYILDRHLQLVPIVVPGELHIGGVGLARGYLNHPEKTAEAFIPNPFSDESGSRLYKTGDLACYQSDGQIKLLGRLDHQVKIRGFRIELGEIEAVLNTYPQIQQAVVIATENNAGDKRLVAYIVVTTDESCTPNQLREFLKQKLPEYMVPSSFVSLDTLPLTPNGKVDLKALPAPDGEISREHEYVAPRTASEEIIANIFASVLSVQNVGIHDNFFDLGGNSLLTIRVHQQLREQLNIDLSLLDLFKYPTISSLAEYLSQVENEPSSVYTTEVETEKISASKDRGRKLLQKMKSI
ncbi:MAG: amino acid adenylation domain-containing protein [Symploca sp. SIO2G7]|nr:amino acid adenylation domain-containing protein [Symploca sp. SIO2G7]